MGKIALYYVLFGEFELKPSLERIVGIQSLELPGR